MRLLARRLGQLDLELRTRNAWARAQSQIQQLSVAQLEELSEALLDFSTIQDLTDWLQVH